MPISSFSSKDIGDNKMILSLHNLGVCKEVFLGIIRYFKRQIASNCMPEEILNFEVNIYSRQGCRGASQ